MLRNKTKIVKIGNIAMGGDENVLIQSMCDIKTSNVEEVIKEINECAKLGASLMRVSIIDEDDLKAIPLIKKSIDIPLVCDIHYTLKDAIKAIEYGADAIRINPGNTKKEELDNLIEIAKKHKTAIRIGINEGSFSSKNEKPIHEQLVSEALKWVEYFENLEFYNLVISVKSSDLFTTIKSYELLGESTSYPLHIGLTESGFDDIGIIKSVACLSPILLKGIGSTIRISLTHDPLKEVLTAKRLLKSLNLYKNYPNFVSCPTCGRCKVSNIKDLAKETLTYLENNNINLKVAVMGCVVNGIGEGKNADIGLAGANHEFIIFKKGEVIKTVKEENALEEFFKEIDKMKN